MNFQGWLLKIGDVKLPNSFIVADGWKSTPNQRIEIDAYRDANVLLHRETSSNYKTKLSLNIRSLELQEMEALRNVIGLAQLPESFRNQRRVALTYWNDEELEYKTGIFYMPNIDYTIYKVDEETKNIFYNEFTMEFIEY